MKGCTALSVAPTLWATSFRTHSSHCSAFIGHANMKLCRCDRPLAVSLAAASASASTSGTDGLAVEGFAEFAQHQAKHHPLASCNVTIA